jgi:hypothetical protein
MNGMVDCASQDSKCSAPPSLGSYVLFSSVASASRSSAAMHWQLATNNASINVHKKLLRRQKNDIPSLFTYLLVPI